MSDPWEIDDIAEAARAAAVNFEAVLISFRKDRNGINITLTLNPHDVPDELMLAPVGARYQIAAVRLDDDERPAVPVKTEGERAVMSAGILCRDEEFQEWLVKEGIALSPNEDAAKAAVYSTCGISSRKELRTNAAALLAYHKLAGRYEEWLMKRTA